MLTHRLLPYTAAIALGRDTRAARAISFLISSGLYRLVAGSCLSGDVSDALLRLLAGWRCAPEQIFYVVAGAGDFAGASISVSCRNIVRDRDR